jgi:hypothetical protein
MIVAFASPPLLAFVTQPSAYDWPIVAIFIVALVLGELLSRIFTSRR